MKGDKELENANSIKNLSRLSHQRTSKSHRNDDDVMAVKISVRSVSNPPSNKDSFGSYKAKGHDPDSRKEPLLLEVHK